MTPYTHQQSKASLHLVITSIFYTLRQHAYLSKQIPHVSEIVGRTWQPLHGDGPTSRPCLWAIATSPRSTPILNVCAISVIWDRIWYYVTSPGLWGLTRGQYGQPQGGEVVLGIPQMAHMGSIMRTVMIFFLSLA